MSDPLSSRRGVPRLSTEELWQVTGADQPAAREVLAGRLAPLARRLAARYRYTQEPNEDLLQVAELGLWQAIERFDPARGVPFASFAVPTILGELRRHFRTIGWAAHVPRATQELVLRAQRTAAVLSETSGRSPSIPELAEAMGADLERVTDALIASGARFTDSLDAPGGSDGAEAFTLHDRLGDEDPGYALSDSASDFATAIKQLPCQERRAVELRAEEGLKQREIAERMGCSQMNVSRLLRRARSRLTA